MNYTLFTSAFVGSKGNVLYPNKAEITSADEMDRAIKFDHVCAKYKDNKRSSNNFLSSDVIVMDCDNDHSDIASNWITAEKLNDLMPDISYVVVPSRNNNKAKDGKCARPRFHVYFPITETKSAGDYVALKKRIHRMYQFFDSNALDAGRFIYGSSGGNCIWHEGWLYIDEELDDVRDNGGASHSVITQGNRNSTLSRFAARVLKRFGDTDEAYGKFLEMNGRCEPPLEDKELENIWNSALRFFKNTVAKDPSYIPAAEYGADNAANAPERAWDEPLPLEGDELPEFPIEVLPPALANYASAVAKSTQTPVDMAAVAALTTASACMRKNYRVEGSPDWCEPTNIYSVIVAEPSERKTAVTSLITRPVDSFICEYNEKHKFEFEKNRATKQKLENKKNALISQTRKKSEVAADDFDEALNTVIRELVDFKEVKPLRIYVDDTTPEKLTETMAENDGSIAIISSEGGIFDVISGAYANRVNIDVFLKAYSGENVSVDRIMRQSVRVDKACLTILLSVQPVVISELISNKRFRHRGLTARFLYTTPKSFVGTRILESRPIPQASYQDYKEMIYNILAENGRKNAEIIRLTDEARTVLASYYDWVEKLLVGEMSMYCDWLGKLVGNTLRIAGILARCSILKKDVDEAFLETDPPIVIDKVTMENAIKLGRYFMAHAINSYGDMGVRTGFKAASKVLAKLKEKKLTSITRRDLMRCCHWIGSADNAQDILNNLEDYGYVRLDAVDRSDKLRNGRPKNALYAINPSVLR